MAARRTGPDVECGICGKIFRDFHANKGSKYCSQKCNAERGSRVAASAVRHCKKCGSFESIMPGRWLCRPCHTARCNAWAERNPERAKELAQASEARMIANGNRQAYLDRTKIKRAQRQLEYRRKRREDPTFRANEKARRRTVGTYTERDWQRLVARHNGCCAYCGASRPLTRDHVVPIVRGGSNFIGNILPACGPCNFSKQAKTLTEWRYRNSRHLASWARVARIQNTQEAA